MNKKILITLFSILSIVVISSAVFATFNGTSSTNDKVIISNELVLDINDTYVKLDCSNIDVNKYIQLVEKYLNTYHFIDGMIDTSNIKIESYDNNLDSISEIVLSNSDMIAVINSKTDELISYINQKTNFEKNSLSKAEINEVALGIFENIDNIQNYKIISLTQFDDEIYQAKFCKKYGKYINPGELISFSFAPQTREILTFSKKSIPFANNSIQIDENTSREIARKYFEQSSATDMSLSLEIVVPNYCLTNSLDTNQVYKKAVETRLAYVYRFNNPSHTEIYIDCTTGEVIGIDMMLGGDF